MACDLEQRVNDPDERYRALKRRDEIGKNFSKFTKEWIETVFKSVQMTIVSSLIYYAGVRVESTTVILLSGFLSLLTFTYLYVALPYAVEEWVDAHEGPWVQKKAMLLLGFAPSLAIFGVMVLATHPITEALNAR